MEQETITLRDAVTAIMNESESTGHFRIEFAEGVSEIAMNSCLNINHRGNLTINGDRDRDGTADVNIDHGPGFLDWLGAINAIASDTYLVGLRFDGSDNSGKATFLSLRVPDEHGPADTYNIENLYVLGCEFINNYDVGVATCGAYGYGASGYSEAGTSNFSNLVFAGNTFNKAGLFSFAGAGDEDYNVIDGYTIAANQFVNGGIGMLAGDAHTWYVYGQDSAQGNGGVPGQIGYCENNILRNVLISGNSLELNDQAGEEYTSIIQVSGANLGNSGNLVDTITIRNNTSKVLDPEGRNVFATLALGNVSIGDGGNLPNYAAPEFIHQTSDNMVRNVTMEYNDFQLGGGREFLVYNVTTDVGGQEGSGNLFRNIRIDNNRFDSPNGVSIANYMDKSKCGTCSGNNTEGIYFTNNTVTTNNSRDANRPGIVVSGAMLTNQFGSAVTDMPDYSGTMETIVIDGNTINGDYQYGILAAGSAGDYANGLGIDGLSVSGNNINLINADARFGIVAAGGAMGTYGDPENNAPYQPGSTNCFLKNVAISENTITSEGGIAVAGDLYESAPRADSIAGNHVDTIAIQNNVIAKQAFENPPTKDLPGILVAGIVDIWDRLSLPTPMPTLGGNKVTGATIGANSVTGFDAGKEILDLTAVSGIYPVNSAVTGEAILNELKTLTDSAYGENSYGWAWSGTAYDSSVTGSYMAKGSRQTGMGIEAMYYEAVVDPDAYDNTEGTVTVTTEAQFLTALDDPAVTHIIAKWVVLNIQQGTVLTKDLTLADSSNLNIIDNGLLIVATGVTLTLDGNTAIQQNGELRIGGILVNNGTLTVGGSFLHLPRRSLRTMGLFKYPTIPKMGLGVYHYLILSAIRDRIPLIRSVLSLSPVQTPQ